MTNLPHKVVMVAVALAFVMRAVMRWSLGISVFDHLQVILLLLLIVVAVRRDAFNPQ